MRPGGKPHRALLFLEPELLMRPAAFVLTSTDHGTLIVGRNDYHLTADGGGYGVGHQLLTSGSFDPGEVFLAKALLERRRAAHGDGVVALDVGANIGVHTVEWARFMTGWGEVHGFEAQERIFYALAGNVALNNCLNAQVQHAAVGNGHGFIRVPRIDYTRPASYGSLEVSQRIGTEDIGQPFDYERGYLVDMLTIDGLALGRCDLIKVDVEGMELDVLQGAANTIADHRPILLVEWIKTNRETLTAMLEGWGYDLLPAGINVLALHRADPVRARVEAADGGLHLT